MKKIAITLVSIIALLVAGFASLNFFGKRWDAESKAYVDAAIPKIAAQWDANELISRESDEFRATAPVDQIQALVKQFNDLLGPLKEYKGSKGEANIALHIGGPSSVTAGYLARATFEKGDAEIAVQLVHRNGGWQILGFHVNPVDPNAPNIKVLGMGQVHFTQGPPALMLKYETNLPIDDKVALSHEADQIWPKFRIDVENSKLDNAIISANEAVKDPGLISKGRGYNFVYRKAADGSWERLGDGNVWQRVN